MNPARKYLASIGFVSVLLLTYGCGISALSMVTMPAAAVNAGTMAYQSIENAQILIRVHEGLTKESLREIRNVAVFMGRESRVKPYGRIGDIEAVVGDNLAIQLMGEGFRIYGADDITKVEGRPHTDADYHRGEMLRTCEALGAQAMISANVVAVRKGFTILEIGRQRTVVHSVSLSVTEVKTTRTLMTIDIQYKIGQRPNVVAEGLAMIIKAKLNDPDADIQALFRKKKNDSSNTPIGNPDHPEDPLSFSDSLP
ncbi:MAG: hypothetical protein Q7J01_09865 [Syntrophales bacterium]|nr:hypothetical protein [Syntrophales bacterium]